MPHPRALSPLLAAAGLGLALTSTGVSAAVILDDDFEDGTNPGYTVVPGPTANDTATVTTDPAAGGLDTNVLLLSTVSNNRRLNRDFDAITLAVNGDYLEVSVDYRLAQDLNDRDAVNIGFAAADGSEAGARFNPTAGGNQGIYYTDLSNNNGRFDTIASGTDPHSVTVRLTRESETVARLNASFDGQPRDPSNDVLLGADFTAPLTYDSLRLGWVNGNAGDLYFDNVLVTSNVVVPEPASLTLAALGLTACMLRRRS